MQTFDGTMHEQPKREIVDVYDGATKLYDQGGIKSCTYYARLLVARLNIPSGARVLDVAAGCGAFLFAAADKVRVNGYILGMDHVCSKYGFRNSRRD